jgi:hypothetical protein
MSAELKPSIVFALSLRDILFSGLQSKQEKDENIQLREWMKIQRKFDEVQDKNKEPYITDLSYPRYGKCNILHHNRMKPHLISDIKNNKANTTKFIIRSPVKRNGSIIRRPRKIAYIIETVKALL